jgi:hypothetical protein
LKDSVDVCIASVCVDGSDFKLVYCHIQLSTLAEAVVIVVWWVNTWDIGRVSYMFLLSGQVSLVARCPLPGLPT